MLDNIPKDAKFLSRMKVLQSPDLLAILKRMENGDKLVGDPTKSSVSISTDGWMWNNAGIRKVRTLERAGLIAPVEYDDYIEYRLTYKGSIEELVRK